MPTVRVTPAMLSDMNAYLDMLRRTSPEALIGIWNKCVFNKYPKRIVAMWDAFDEERLLEDLDPHYPVKFTNYAIKTGEGYCLWRDGSGNVYCGTSLEALSRISVPDLVDFIYAGCIDYDDDFWRDYGRYAANISQREVVL